MDPHLAESEIGKINSIRWAGCRERILSAKNNVIRLSGKYNLATGLSSDGEIDYYVYITATGDLERKLSSGIVSFTDVVSLFRENKQLVRTPVWVIGIDIDDT